MALSPKSSKPFTDTLHRGRLLGLCGVLVVGMLWACQSQAKTTYPPSDEQYGFIESFSDEFDGPDIDLSKWYVLNRHDKYWPESPWRRNYKNENAYIEDGALVLRTVRDAKGFSSAAIQTKDDGKAARFQQRYGRWEARLKFPHCQGHWCAFWLMSDSVGREDGSGRDGTEIDIIEKASLSDRAQHALHWDGYGSAHKSASKALVGLGLNDGDWHVVRLDWFPSQYVFYLDGKETWRCNDGGVSQAMAYILLSEEIGNFGQGPEAWGGGPIENEALPDYFYVDYVRVWALSPYPPKANLQIVRK